MENDKNEHDERRAVTDTVYCKFCGEPTLAAYAHLHEGECVGDECCWDERLRSTE